MMSKSSKKDDICVNVFLTFILLISSSICIYSTIQEIKNGNLMQKECFIDKVQIPKEIPSKSINNWIYCHKGYTSCINLYSNDIKLMDSPNKKKDKCTFVNNTCDKTQYQQELKQAQKIYNNYFNNTIKCFQYKKTNEYYINKNNDFKAEMIVFGIISGILLIAVVSNCVFNYHDYYKKSKEKIVVIEV